MPHTDLEVMPGPAELLQHQSAGLSADAAVALLPGAQKEVVISWFVCEPARYDKIDNFLQGTFLCIFPLILNTYFDV